MPFDYHLGDLVDDKSLVNAQISNQKNPTGPLKTTESQASIPRQALTSYGLSDAMQGIAVFKPAGVSYDVFNNQLSTELQNLGTEDKWKSRDSKLTPYDIFLKDVDPSTASSVNGTGAANVGATAAANSSSSAPPTGSNTPQAGGDPIAGNNNSGMIWPTKTHPISQEFGTNGHPGIDISVPSGTTIYAPLDGVVTDTNANGTTNPDGYGQFFLYIKHRDDLYTLYAHIKQRLVTTGQTVKQGDPIAISGGNAGDPGHGYSTGAHLHFETRTGPYGGWGNLSNPTIKNPRNYLGQG